MRRIYTLPVLILAVLILALGFGLRKETEKPQEKDPIPVIQEFLLGPDSAGYSEFLPPGSQRG